MDSDLLTVLGLSFVVVSIPATLSAFAESRSPVASIALFLTGLTLMILAIANGPEGYGPGQIPDAVVRVMVRIFG